MKNVKKILAVALTLGMVLSVAACGQTTETPKKKKKKKTKKTTTTITETTEEPGLSTSYETDPPSESTSETEKPSATLSPDFKAPEKGCAIAIPTEERYQYVMDLTLDAKENTVGGHVEVTFFNNSDESWEELCLRDYSSLFVDADTSGITYVNETNGALTEITNITDSRDKSKIEMKRDDDVSVVWFMLSKVLAPKEKMTLSYDFVAKIPTLADRYGVKNGVYNVTNFYPILAVYTENGWSHEAFYNEGECFFSEVSDYEVTLRVPKDFTALTTGTASSEKTEGSSKIYTIDAPCVRDFVFSACETFDILEGDYNGVHINIAYNSAHPATKEMEDVQAASLKASQDSLAALGSAFGEYPYPEVDVILATIDAGGMEYPNLVIITDDQYYTRKNVYETIPYEELGVTIAHELGHQWFMGIVGNNSGLEPWLDESFASYSETVYEAWIGLSERYEFFSRDSMDLSHIDNMAYYPELPINRSRYAFPNMNDYLNAVYFTGKAALFQMGEIIGRDEFNGVIREYVQRNAFTNSTEERFFEVLYECTGKDNELLNTLIKNVFNR